MTPWTIACQAPLSMGFSRQEYWSGLPFPSPGDLSNPGIEPASPALAGGFLITTTDSTSVIHTSALHGGWGLILSAGQIPIARPGHPGPLATESIGCQWLRAATFPGDLHLFFLSSSWPVDSQFPRGQIALRDSSPFRVPTSIDYA